MKNKEIWLFIAFLSLCIFNWPFLEIFRDGVITYLFLAWAMLIIVAGTIAGRDKDREGEKGA